MKKLRIAIIGCGGISTFNHAPEYLKFEDVEIVATCDIIIERAVKMAKTFGLSDDLAFSDYKDVLKLVKKLYYNNFLIRNKLNSTSFQNEDVEFFSVNIISSLTI